MPKARTSHFNVALFSTPKPAHETTSWWTHPEIQQDRQKFVAKLVERANTVFAPSSLPLHRGQK